MKKIMILTAVVLFFAVSVSAKVLYVSSVKTNLYKDSSRKSVKITSLKKNSRLQVVSEKGRWVKIKYGSKKGWVNKMFTSKKKKGGKISLLGSAGQSARIHARKRASSNVTAASARGLMADNEAANSRSRSASGNAAKFDPALLSKIEAYYISEDNLLKFLSELFIRKISFF